MSVLQTSNDSFVAPARCLAALVVFLLSLCAVAESIHTETMVSARLRVSTEDRSMSRSLIRYAERCSNRVDKLLGCSTMPLRNVLICASTCTRGKPQRELEYRFTPETDMLSLTAGIVRVLLKRRQFELNGKASDAQVLDFLSAGIAYSYMMTLRMEGDFVDFDYRPARSSFNEGVFPDGKGLFLHPMCNDLPWLYRLYAMHASLLLNCFRSLNENVYLLMLEAEAKGQTPEQIFERAVVSQLPENTVFQQWYQTNVVSLVQHDWAGDKSESIEAKIHELETVSVIGAGGFVAELVPVKIDDSKESIDTLRRDTNLLHKRQNEFLRLRNESPVLLRAPLEKYAKALGYLAADDVRAFKRTLKEARKDFSAAMDRQQRLELELQKYEREHTLPIRRYQPELEILWHFQQLEKALVPQMKGDMAK